MVLFIVVPKFAPSFCARN